MVLKRIKELMKIFLKNYVAKNATICLACSSGAAHWIFPNKYVESGKVIIIPNGVDTKKFSYSETKRRIFRTEINIKEELVIGNIGRFQGQKNHTFMISIMEEVVKSMPNTKLLLVGDGERKGLIEKLVKENNLVNNVFFLGERSDMDYFLSAIDVFILPSLYEGLPIAAVEAQTSGAKVLLSNTITKETNIGGNAIFLPIIGEDASSIWKNEIICENKDNRKVCCERVYKAGFDVRVCYQKMIDLYNRGKS